MTDRCIREVVELHQFFEDWFNGLLVDSNDAFARFADAMDESFEIISPDGARTLRRGLMGQLRSAHGVHTDTPIRIWVANASVRPLGDDLFMVSYEEWQRHDDETKGRLSTAIMKRTAAAPNGLCWLHVHETWLPSSTDG